MLSMEDWGEIRRLSKSEGLSINEIRQLGVARNTVRSALRSDELPAYRRAPSGSIVDVLLWRPVLQEIGLQRDEKPEHDRVEDHHEGGQCDLGVGDDRHQHEEDVQERGRTALPRQRAVAQTTGGLPEPRLRFVPGRLAIPVRHSSPR